MPALRAGGDLGPDRGWDIDEISFQYALSRKVLGPAITSRLRVKASEPCRDASGSAITGAQLPDKPRASVTIAADVLEGGKKVATFRKEFRGTLADGSESLPNSHSFEAKGLSKKQIEEMFRDETVRLANLRIIRASSRHRHEGPGVIGAG